MYRFTQTSQIFNQNLVWIWPLLFMASEKLFFSAFRLLHHYSYRLYVWTLHLVWREQSPLSRMALHSITDLHFFKLMLIERAETLPSPSPPGQQSLPATLSDEIYQTPSVSRQQTRTPRSLIESMDEQVIENSRYCRECMYSSY